MLLLTKPVTPIPTMLVTVCVYVSHTAVIKDYWQYSHCCHNGLLAVLTLLSQRTSDSTHTAVTMD